MYIHATYNSTCSFQIPQKNPRSSDRMIVHCRVVKMIWQFLIVRNGGIADMILTKNSNTRKWAANSNAKSNDEQTKIELG